MNNPMTTVATAERTLLTNLHGLADQLDRVGTDHLQTAQARVQASAQAAAQRLQAGMTASLQATLGVAALMDGLNALMTADMSGAALIDLGTVWTEPAALPMPKAKPGEQMIDLAEPAPRKAKGKKATKGEQMIDLA